MTLQDHPRSSIFMSFESQHAINRNIRPILHRLATIHPLRTTERQTDDNHDKGPTFKLTG